jgi:hypothetical protein
MGTAPAFASVSEALDMVQAGLSCLAAAGAARLPAAVRAECLRRLERGRCGRHRGAGLAAGLLHRRAGVRR